MTRTFLVALELSPEDETNLQGVADTIKEELEFVFEVASVKPWQSASQESAWSPPDNGSPPISPTLLG